MTTKQEQAIRKHGENLKGVFPSTAGVDAVKLCKQLRRLETVAHNGATAYCNGEAVQVGATLYDFNADENAWENFAEMILGKLDKVLGFKAAGVPCFVNGDARGYALKTSDEWTRANAPALHRDWGGFGIICPEISANGEG